MKMLIGLAAALSLTLGLADAAPPTVRAENFILCPGDGAAPPDFTGPGCRPIGYRDIDPQGRALWLKAALHPTPDFLAHETPVGLYISGKAASEIWLNGEPLGRNGAPGETAAEETPGRMDAVFYVPPHLLHAGENSLAIRLSGHHSLIRLRAPLHGLMLAPYDEPQDVMLRKYWPSLITFGAFLLGGLYFAVTAFREHGRAGSPPLALMAFFAGGQLLAEAARGVIAYPYPFHDIRLILILCCALGFGLSLTAHIAERYIRERRWTFFGGVAALTLTAVFLSRGFDAKAGVSFLVPTLACAIGAAFWTWRKKPQAVYYLIALGAFAALIVLFQQLFLDVFFYYAVACLMLFLFTQQALRLAQERKLRRNEEERARRLELALEQARQNDGPDQITVKNSGKIEFIAADQISHCNGAGDYVALCLKSGGEVLHSGSLNEMEDILPATFLRVHRSHIVNTAMVKSLVREASGVGRLEMTTGASVPVSRRIMPKVRSALA